MPACVTEMVGQLGFDDGRVGGEQISKLICNPGKGPSQSAGRKFIQMHRNNPPGSLHHELDGKPTHDKEREARLADHFRDASGHPDYAKALALFTLVIFLVLIVLAAIGREERGKEF